jgi:hypothetical protein
MCSEAAGEAAPRGEWIARERVIYGEPVGCRHPQSSLCLSTSAGERFGRAADGYDLPLSVLTAASAAGAVIDRQDGWPPLGRQGDAGLELRYRMRVLSRWLVGTKRTARSGRHQDAPAIA